MSLITGALHMPAVAGGCAAALLFFTGCADLPRTTATGQIQDIHIGATVVPRELYVSVGDEVRWLNRRDTPVQIGFLGKAPVKHASCERGFQFLGAIQDFVTIPPHDYVSLCFAERGKVLFNVWWNLEHSRGALSRTATIHISRRLSPPRTLPA